MKKYVLAIVLIAMGVSCLFFVTEKLSGMLIYRPTTQAHSSIYSTSVSVCAVREIALDRI